MMQIIIGNSTITMNMMVSALYAAYLRKPTLLYGEPAAGKSVLAEFMHDISDIQYKFMRLPASTRLNKIEPLLDKKEHVVYLPDINQWANNCISYVSQKLLEFKPWIVLSFASGNYYDVMSFLNKYEYPAKEMQMIYVPSLRERKEDLIVLADHVIAMTAQKYKIAPKQLSKNAKLFIENFPWYGNFEEFNNSIKNALFSSKQHNITEEDLRKYIKVWPESKARAISDFDTYVKEIIRDFKYANWDENSRLYATIMEEADKVLIAFAMKQSATVKTACQLLGMSPNTFRKKYAKRSKG
jgi:DNA-binding NtrC family response regulator